MDQNGVEELRQPLNLIRNFAHILQGHGDVLDGDEIVQAAAAIEHQSEIALQALDQAGQRDSLQVTSESDAEGPARDEPYRLSPREKEVLVCVAQGLADKQIAAALSISTFTVNRHVSSLLTKMKAASRTEVGVRAIKEGLV
jgi:DNA-binding NarL/FixJ family response regulator